MDFTEEFDMEVVGLVEVLRPNGTTAGSYELAEDTVIGRLVIPFSAIPTNNLKPNKQNCDK